MMNKQELHEAFSQIHASDDLIGAVCALDKETKQRPNTWTIVRRVAAVAAVIAMLLTAALWPMDSGTEEPGIVAVPGVLKVYACALEDRADISELQKYELTDTINSYRRVMVPHVSGLAVGFGIPFTFQIPDDYFGDAKITFSVSVDYGYFCVDRLENDTQEETVINNGETIRWLNGSLIEAEEKLGSGGRFFGNVIIYADKTIVGYGVIDFVYYAEDGMMPSFVTTGFTTICFPQIDGEYQNVSDEYVWKEIEKYKHTKLGQAEE